MGVNRVVPEARGHFMSLEEGKRSQLEAVTGGLVKTRLTENIKCVL